MNNDDLQRLREEFLQKLGLDHPSDSLKKDDVYTDQNIQLPFLQKDSEPQTPSYDTESTTPLPSEQESILEIASSMELSGSDVLEANDPVYEMKDFVFEPDERTIIPSAIKPQEFGIKAPKLTPQDPTEIQSQEKDPYDEKQEQVTHLSEISIIKLKEEMDHILWNHYQSLRVNWSDLYNENLPFEKNIEELYETKLGRYFTDIYRVASIYNGEINKDAVNAVNALLPILWKAELSEAQLIPEDWYTTNFGYLCRYIKLGSIHQTFDPIDMVTAATILRETEEQVVEKVKELGGVQVSKGIYIFSKQKVEEYLKEKGGSDKIREKEEELKQVNLCLAKVSAISRSLDTMSNQIQLVQNALQSEILGGDLERLNALIEQNIQKAYDEYSKLNQQVSDIYLVAPDVYELHPVLDPIANLDGETVTRVQYLASVEESLSLIKQQIHKTIYLKDFLIQNVGQLTVEITTLKLNLDN